MAALSWFWSGAVTSSGFTVAAKVDTAGASCRLAVSAASNLTSPTYFGPVVADSDGFVKLAATGLPSATGRYYGVEVAGSLVTTATKVGFVTTFPTAGVASNLNFVHGSCGTPNPAKVYDKIRTWLAGAGFFIQGGDIHYADIATNDASLFRTQFDHVHTFDNEQPALYRSVAAMYMPDDHDSGGDDADRTFTSMPACHTAYQQCFPHYPLAVAGTRAQSWTFGRFGFIFPDMRGASDPIDTLNDPVLGIDSPTKTLLGVDQKAWYKQTLLDMRDAGCVYIMLIHSRMWPFTATSTVRDTYANYAYERTELADFIRDNILAHCRVRIMQGDGHEISYDPYGMRSDFATGGGCPIPNFIATPFNQTSDGRRGRYYSAMEPSTPASANNGRYSRVTMTDNGVLPTFKWEAYEADNTTGSEALIVSHTDPVWRPGGLRVR